MNRFGTLMAKLVLCACINWSLLQPLKNMKKLVATNLWRVYLTIFTFNNENF